jgi:hypothetical protein
MNDNLKKATKMIREAGADVYRTWSADEFGRCRVQCPMYVPKEDGPPKDPIPAPPGDMCSILPFPVAVGIPCYMVRLAMALEVDDLVVSVPSDARAVRPASGAASGWICPKCSRVYGPGTAVCYYCHFNNEKGE